LSTTANANDPFSGGRALAVYYNSAVGTCTNLFYSAGYSGWLSLTCSNYASSNYIINGAMSVNGKCLPINSINAATLCSELQAKNYAHLPRGLSGVEFADRDLAYAPGEYQYDLSNGTSTTVKLKEADIVEVSVPLPVVGTLPSQFKTRIDFLSTRELPDAVTAVIGSSVSGERTYSVPVSSNASLNLKAYVNSSAAYSLTAAGRTVQLDQTQDNVVKLNRVDIDDVTITRENGTTYVVRGTYELYFGGNRVAGPYATNSGIDALPGDYELVIMYRTAEGDQTDRSTITL
jgi:hypothetical protein